MSIDRIVIFLVLRYFSCFQGIFSVKTSRPGVIQIDGEKYVKKFIKNESVAGKPEYLLFTAPYRLCEGGCHGDDDTNLAMAFPLFIGNKGNNIYKEIYPNAKDNGTGTGKKGLFNTKPSRIDFTTVMCNVQTHSTGYPQAGEIKSTSPYYGALRYPWNDIFVPAYYSNLRRYNKFEDDVPYSSEIKKEYTYRKADSERLWHTHLIRSDISMDEPARLPVIWRPTQRTRLEPNNYPELNIAHLTKRRQNKWSAFGLRPVLPIRDKK